DPDLVVSTAAHVLGVREIGQRSPLEAVTDAIAMSARPLLLVLDNFEQVLGAAPLVTALLEGCANLKILVTSRAVLRVYGEHDFEVPPLAVPALAARPTLDMLARSPAVALFVQRAEAVKSGFTLDASNAAAIAEICARLDGLPLAIELAAARVRMLTPAAMLQRLQHSFELLTGGARDLPARQQTLRATVEWSHGLLTPEEQTLFRRLSVFVNGATLEAVEAVCNAKEDLGIDILDAVDSLVGQSLVQRAEPADQEARFTMLEIVREYARQQLAASPDETLMRRAHAAYCLVLAEESQTHSTPEDRARWMARCDLELNNFRAALDWAERTPEAEWGLRMAGALTPYWVAREAYTEGHERLVSLLALPSAGTQPASRLTAMYSAADLLQHQSRFDQARAFYEQALALNREIAAAPATLARGLTGLAVLELRTGRFDSARKGFDECLALARATGSHGETARALLNLAQVLHAEGDLAAARGRCEAALATLRSLRETSALAWAEMQLGDLAAEEGDSRSATTHYESALATFQSSGEIAGVARALLDLGVLAARQGDHPRSRSLLSRALGHYRELGHRVGIARAIDGFSRSALLRGQHARALRLAAAADGIRQGVGAPLFAQEECARTIQLDEAREILGASAAAIEREGRAMHPNDAMAYAQDDGDGT
ncbi:MAG TPA: tetratricopeptide repeat protein, partial [Vicinamibacterales bacterium]|nr:tetratricopeptide repeat protein [Vicinamibacterales bacterium]